MLSTASNLRTSCLMLRRIGQVIAPLLIVKRVAEKNASPSNTITTGNISSSRSQRESKGSGGVLPSGYPMDSVGKYRETPGELRVGVETTIDLRRDNGV